MRHNSSSSILLLITKLVIFISVMFPAEQSSRIFMVRATTAAASAAKSTRQKTTAKTTSAFAVPALTKRAFLADGHTATSPTGRRSSIGSSRSSSSRLFFTRTNSPSISNTRNLGLQRKQRRDDVGRTVSPRIVGFPLQQQQQQHQQQQYRLYAISRNIDETKQNTTISGSRGSGAGGGNSSDDSDSDDDIDSAVSAAVFAGPRAPTPPSSSFDASSILAIDPTEVEIITVPAPPEPVDTLVGFEDGEHVNTDDAVTGYHTGSSSDNYNGNAVSSLAPDLLRQLPFVGMFRGSANYIANHRGTLAVYHIPGGLLDKDYYSNSPPPQDNGQTKKKKKSTQNVVFRDLMNDIALTWLLGMKIVLVVGCRHQIEKRLAAKAAAGNHDDEINNSHLSGMENDRSHGLRVTDEDMLRIVKEEAGYVRFEVERQLARSLRMQGSGGKPMGGGGNNNDGYFTDGNVVSGNFYSAQPFGILNGIDYKYTGFVRRVEVEKIRQLHNSRDICLLTTLGVSPSGEVFNVNSECLAASVAGALEASKIIYFTEKEMELRHKVHDNKIQSLRLSDARRLLEYHGISCHKKGFVTMTRGEEEKDGDSNSDDLETENKQKQDDKVEMTRDARDMLLRIGWSIQALEQGVKRAHIISPKFGAVLQELYTRDGSGTLVSGDLYEGIRRATVHDVSGIHDLISPLIQAGTLIDRPKATLEKDVDMYYVYTRDNHIVACGQLKIFEQGFAEIGCLVVNADYRARGRGDAMLGYLERLALVNGCSSIFVLSTQTMEWFLERGFDEVSVDRLPPSRQAMYNYKRKSKIYLKKIESARDLDASELWWNR